MKPWTTNRILWLFWDGPDMPTYVKLCEKTLRKNAGLEVVLLNEEKAWELIGARPPHYDALKHWAHKADIIRWSLIYKYGGVWLDVDTLVTRSIASLIDEAIDKNRLVLLKHSMEVMPKSSYVMNNNVIAAPAKHPLVQDILRDHMQVLISNKGRFAWYEFIRVMHYNLIHTQYDYRLLHPQDFCQPWDHNKLRPGSSGFDIFSAPTDDIEYYIQPGSYGYQVHNSHFTDQPCAKWSEEELLSSDMIIGRLLRDALGADE